MRVQDGTITYVGPTTDELAQWTQDSDTQVIDLNGQTVLPGFIDGHIHLLLAGQALRKVRLNACQSLDDIRNAIKEYKNTNPKASRIFCAGWTHSMTPDGITAESLDDLGEEPIFIDTKDLHSTWCNSAGLKEICSTMELSEDQLDPVGGKIERDSNGKMTGVFHESAVFNIIWPFTAKVSSLEERKDAIKAALEEFKSAGYTGVTDMAMDELIWQPLMQLRAEGGLKGIRVAAYWLIKPQPSFDEVMAQVHQATALAKNFDASISPDCRVVGIKLICDGIIDACTASLAEPYSSNSDNSDPIWNEDDLDKIVEAAQKAGLQIALHAIGDRTIKMAIDVLERHSNKASRPRIEHLELASAEDAARLGKLGIVASIQPVHADPAILKAWPRLIGEHRRKRAFPYREFVDGGATLALGSDAPTAPHQPLPNIYVATTRRSYRDPELTTTVNPEFALTVCQAMAGATQGSAYSTFADKWAGTLAPGKKADFVVCDVDLQPENVVRGVVKETWFEGQKTFTADGDGKA